MKAEWNKFVLLASFLPFILFVIEFVCVFAHISGAVKMNTSPTNSDSDTLRVLAQAIAKLILRFRFSRSRFLTLLDEELVLQAKNNDPQANNVTLSIRTGINRRYIPQLLSGETMHSKPERLKMILEDLKWTSQKHYQSGRVPLKGSYKTFETICEIRASGTLTYKAILEELMKQGKVKVVGNEVEIILNNSEEDNKHSKFARNSVEKVFFTVEEIIQSEKN